MKRIALFFLCLGGAARAGDYLLPEPPSGPRLDYAADEVELDSVRRQLHLRGQVVLHESGWTVKSRELWIDMDPGVGRSEGPLTVEDGVSSVSGESGQFDFARHTGRLQRASARHADWLVHAREARVGENGRLEYLDGEFTNREPSRYRFRASRITMKPKSMLARHVRLYWGGVPVFYLPFWYKSL